MAQKYDKTISQILIRWAIDHNIGVIPKSNKKNRIEENGSIFDFELSTDDMSYLNNLDIHYHCAWDPCNVE